MNDSFDPNAPARSDSGLFGLSCPLSEAGVHVIPVPFDATTSYRDGAALGPEAILPASHQVDLYDVFVGRPWREGISLRPTDPRFAKWNEEARRLATEVRSAREEGKDPFAFHDSLRRVNAIGSEVNSYVHGCTDKALDAGALPVVLGGDHAVPFGAIHSIARSSPGFGILHFDAHADLRRAYEGFEWSHASIMHNVLERVDGVKRIVQVGVRDLCDEEAARIESDPRVRTLFDEEWSRARAGSEPLVEVVRRTISQLPEEVYVSFDIDGLDPSLCPNTGTPVPGGLTWHDAMLWLGELAASGRRVIGLDLVEVAPGPTAEGEDSWDAIVGARLLYKLIGVALLTRK